MGVVNGFIIMIYELIVYATKQTIRIRILCMYENAKDKVLFLEVSLNRVQCIGSCVAAVILIFHVYSKKI